MLPYRGEGSLKIPMMPLSQVWASQEVKKLLPEYIEQGTKQEPLSQFAERAGSGLEACSSSEELCWLSARAQVRVYVFSFVLC